MSLVQRLLGCSLLVCAVLTLGCGGDEYGRAMATVKGKVTIKGTPVNSKDPNRLILIFEKQGERPESVDVKSDGTYSGQAPSGPNKVKLQIYGNFEGIKRDFAQDVTVESGKSLDFEVGQ